MTLHYKMNDTGFFTETPFGKLEISPNDEYGFRPYMLLVSSIVGCSGNLLRNILEKKRISIDDLTIDATVKRNEEEANRIEEIHLHITIFGNDLDETKIKKSLDVTKKYCAMIQSVKDSIKVEKTFELKER